MTDQTWTRSARRTWLATIAAVLAFVSLVCPAAAATTGTSLDWTPDDAALYSSMLRCAEQMKIIAASRAWKNIQAMPAVKMAWEAYEKQSAEPGNPAAQVKMALSDPQVRDALMLLADMFSEEVFVYADADTVGAFDLLQQMNTAISFGPLVVAASGDSDLEEEQVQAMLAIGVLSENLDKVKVPGMVMGFRLTDTNRAVLNLGKIEMVGGIVLAQVPTLAGSMKRTKVGEHEYVVLTLRGDMIPWDMLPLDEVRELEPEEGCVDKLVEKIKKETLVVALGLRGDYLLMAIGSSTDVIARLGQGTPLIERPELKPVVELAEKRLAGVDYVSAPLNDVLNNSQRQIDDLVEVVGQIVPNLDIDESAQARIRKDAEALAADLKRLMPTRGALVNVSFLTDAGMETYMYNYGTRPDLDATQPLGLLAHVGGTPLLAVIARQKGSVEDYDVLVKWLKVGYGYFEKYGLPEMDDAEREKFEDLAAAAGPILERLDQANRELLIPALDGQFGFVVDGQLKSKQFLTTLPATEEAMPMAEPAFVLGLRDTERMRQALVEYWEILQDALDAAADVEPDLAELVLPDPTPIETSEGMLYAFVPPAECPVDKQIAPNVGVGKEVCVFSMSQAHTRRLLKSTPFAAAGALDEVERPMAVAVALDWAGLVKAASPWIDLATGEIVRDQMSSEAAEAQLPGIREQVHTVLDALATLRRVTSETVEKDGVIVTHVMVEIKDVE
ncbi:MAG: hypothetical protein JW809_12765 [Pirellulales bacterium]|nr:hypothetical protein [Pirellulales bacterium]